MQRMLFVSGLTFAAWMTAGTALAQEAPDPDAMADALESRLHDLQDGTSELRAGVGESYRRLAAIEMSISGRVDGARA